MAVPFGATQATSDRLLPQQAMTESLMLGHSARPIT
jgi:hypothetical protein